MPANGAWGPRQGCSQLGSAEARHRGSETPQVLPTPAAGKPGGPAPAAAHGGSTKPAGGGGERAPPRAAVSPSPGTFPGPWRPGRSAGMGLRSGNAVYEPPLGRGRTGLPRRGRRQRRPRSSSPGARQPQLGLWPPWCLHPAQRTEPEERLCLPTREQRLSRASRPRDAGDPPGRGEARGLQKPTGQRCSRLSRGGPNTGTAAWSPAGQHALFHRAGPPAPDGPPPGSQRSEAESVWGLVQDNVHPPTPLWEPLLCPQTQRGGMG